MPTFDAGTSGLVGTVAVTVLEAASGTVHAARATSGITEVATGSGVYFTADHDTTIPLIYVWDTGASGIGASETVEGVRGFVNGIGLATEANATANRNIVTGAVADATPSIDFTGLATSGQVDAAQVAIIAAMPDIPPPDDGVTITHQTAGTSGTPLGVVQPQATITVYLSGVAKYQFAADMDGEYTYTLPAGSTWTMVARRVGYHDMTAEVTT